jgi:hypothetical protein
MTPKIFNFSVVDMRAAVTAAFSAESQTLAGAFAIGAKELPALFGDKQPGLRMFRFRFENARTGEFSAFLGQGETIAAAWADAIKCTRDTFRPKNDGKHRPSVGLTVLLGPGRLVSRSVESFQSDETFDQERDRLAAELEQKRLEQGGRAA